jgi:hypothetical protein
MAEHWKRTCPELERDGTSNWDGLIITGWLPPGKGPDEELMRAVERPEDSRERP